MVLERDINMVLRLAHRVSASRGEELDLAVLVSCAMFRGAAECASGDNDDHLSATVRTP
jgi:hypothetical protein